MERGCTMPEESTTETSLYRAWRRYSDDNRLEGINEDLKGFLSLCKTEREATGWLEEDLRSRGGIPVEEAEGLRAGDRVFLNWKGRAFAAARIGSARPEEGVRIIGSHIDSPRIDIKPQPLYEESGLAMLDCVYYGGIKQYQWTNVPLALHGRIHPPGHPSQDLVIGEDEGEPVFLLPDLAPHLDREMDKRKASETVLGEHLDAVAGNRPLKGKDSEKDAVKRQILQYLDAKWNLSERDFPSADLCLVPAGQARDAGLDRGMVSSYGIDDRACAYLSYRAFTDLQGAAPTAVYLAFDREEIGSEGLASAQSPLLEEFLLELLHHLKRPTDQRTLKRCLSRSEALSTDVTEASNPMYKEVFDPRQAPLCGGGIALMKYSGGRGKGGASEADGAFVSRVQRRFDRE
ncbi:MAG: aminopeptidase 1, partial [Synergistales bacterium]|nr:aminopeptidase 1 [Synergistales bacterium]